MHRKYCFNNDVLIPHSSVLMQTFIADSIEFRIRRGEYKYQEV